MASAAPHPALLPVVCVGVIPGAISSTSGERSTPRERATDNALVCTAPPGKISLGALGSRLAPPRASRASRIASRKCVSITDGDDKKYSSTSCTSPSTFTATTLTMTKKSAHAQVRARRRDSMAAAA